MNVRVRGTSIALRGAALVASLQMPAGCLFFGNEEPGWTDSWQEPPVTIIVGTPAVELVQSGDVTLSLETGSSRVRKWT